MTTKVERREVFVDAQTPAVGPVLGSMTWSVAVVVVVVVVAVGVPRRPRVSGFSDACRVQSEIRSHEARSPTGSRGRRRLRP